GDKGLDGLVEGFAAHGAVEAGVAKGEDAAVGSDHVVAVAGWVGDRVEHGAVEAASAHVAKEDGVAEGERPALAGEEPVTPSRSGGCQRGDVLAGAALGLLE